MEITTTPKKKEILEKRGIATWMDLLNFLPRTYKDYRQTHYELNRSLVGKTGVFVGKAVTYKKKLGKNCYTLTLKVDVAGQNVNVILMGKSHMANLFQKMIENHIAVFGELHHHPQFGYSIMEPDRIEFASDYKKYLRIVPVYTKYDGISQDYMDSLIREAFNHLQEYDVPKDLQQKYHLDKLPSTREAYYMMHYPQNMDFEPAQKRLVVNDMLEFALVLEKNELNEAPGTHVVLNSIKIPHSIVESLPYDLTADQKKYFNEMMNSVREGKRISALLQGDVSCGKTLVAILLLFAMAENGYQGVIMAPTSILAGQHYEQIKKYGEEYGIGVGYLDGTLTPSAKKKVLEQVKSGDIKILVGTQALTTGKVEYHKLGMVIIDEEHRFGVGQRDVLMNEAKNGVNTLTMSATPIPRSLAGTIYSKRTEIYDIRTMPSNRMPIQTAISSSQEVIFSFIEKQLSEGRQAYVVCPLIEKKDECERMEGVLSVTEMEAMYKARFEPFYKVGVLNGKMKEQEIASVIERFKAGEMHILISTTVVEVGVNVPNASVMVISNAERFGLAQMHQLRGRVGRGNYKGYCILQSVEKDNPRLNILVNCTDGFSIAEEDLKFRGAGDLTGLQQSGMTNCMEQVLRYPNLFQIIRKLAEDIVERERFALK